MQLSDPPLLRTHCLINGEWLAADSGTTFAVTNPASGAELAQVANAGAAETARAIAAADAAWPAWRKQTAKARGNILRRWFELISAHADDLAAIMTAEQGKPLAEARGEVLYGASYVEWYAEEGKRAYGETLPSALNGHRQMVVQQPVGVCAAITPWNFPSAMITRKVAPALAAGCTIVLKPAEQTPLSALALGELAIRAGIPAGVLNIVTGDAAAAPAIGGELCANPTVRKLSFTGSTAVGRLLLAQSAPTLKKVSLELGGNAPFLVFEDADLKAAVSGAINGKFRNCGQICIAANRFLVHKNVQQAFAEGLAAALTKQKVGAGHEEGVTLGPLIDTEALAKVEALIADAVALGATVVCGGKRHALGGTFFEPTVLANVTPAMRIAREEIFGPVAPIFSFDTEEEAVALANATEYGLAAYAYSRDVGRCFRLGDALEYGMVGLNTTVLGTEAVPFGGMKQSGLGREGGHYGLEEYLEPKHLCFGGL